MSGTQPGSRPASAVVALCTAALLLWPPPVRALEYHPWISLSTRIWRGPFATASRMERSTQSPRRLTVTSGWVLSSGVVRYDGARLTPLPLRPGQQLPNNAAGALLPARDGTVWIGTLDGLMMWKNGELTEYPVFARRTVITLVQHRDGTVWAGSFGGPTGRLCAFRGGQLTCYGDDGQFGASVSSLYEDGGGTLWVGAGTGLWRWTPGAPARYLATPFQTPQSFTPGDRGRGFLVAADDVHQVAGTEVIDYSLRGVPSPLTATGVFGIATVDCGLAQPLMGLCTHTAAKRAGLPARRLVER